MCLELYIGLQRISSHTVSSMILLPAFVDRRLRRRKILLALAFCGKTKNARVLTHPGVISVGLLRSLMAYFKPMDIIWCRMIPTLKATFQPSVSTL